MNIKYVSMCTYSFIFNLNLQIMLSFPSIFFFNLFQPQNDLLRHNTINLQMKRSYTVYVTKASMAWWLAAMEQNVA